MEPLRTLLLGIDFPSKTFRRSTSIHHLLLIDPNIYHFFYRKVYITCSRSYKAIPDKERLVHIEIDWLLLQTVCTLYIQSIVPHVCFYL
jgi:hypothetical protein